MGGGGGGGFSGTINVEEVRAAANRRIKSALGGNKPVAFLAPEKLHAEIVDRVLKTSSLKSLQYEISDLEDANVASAVENSSLIVFYISDPEENSSMSSAADIVMTAKSTMIATQSKYGDFVPTFVQVYRTRIIGWEELSKILI
jgi:hypothetical protein